MLKAVIERAQGILHWVTPEFRDLDRVWKGKPVVVVVVADGGGRAIANYFRSLLSSAQVITAHFSYTSLGLPGFRGGLIKLPEVASRVDRLSEHLYQKLVSGKRATSR